MIAVWKAYGKAVMGTTCPVLGTFAQDGQIYPSSDLAEAAGISGIAEPETASTPKLQISMLAEEANITEALTL
jgi:hypothetical protein